MTYQEMLKQCAKDLWDLTSIGKAEGVNCDQIQHDLNKAILKFALENLEDTNGEC